MALSALIICGWMAVPAVPGPNVSCAARPDNGAQVCAVYQCKYPTLVDSVEMQRADYLMRLHWANPNHDLITDPNGE